MGSRATVAPALASRRLRGGPCSHIAISLRTTTVTLCILAIAVFNTVVVPRAQAAATPAGFRCLRPFSATGTFSNVAKAHPSNNCDFFYFAVEDATAELKCASSSPAAAAAVSDETSCNVTVRWSMRRASDAAARLQRQVGADKDYFTREASTTLITTPPTRVRTLNPSAAPFVTEDADVWRYAVSLKAKGDSAINYKGFSNGDGYSLCCDALEEADCAWTTPQKGDNDRDCDEDVDDGFASQRSRMLRSCPLPFPAPCSAGDVGGDFGTSLGARVALTDLDEDESSGFFHGVITKPLHRIVEGPWEVIVQMWRRRQRTPPDGTDPSLSIPTDQTIETEVLGRIVVPFTLSLAQLQKQGRITQEPSMVLRVKDVAEVVQMAGDKAAGEAGDL
ncbi:hypothetical protein GH5_05840 [Leishmania sp. Ghana 2012 LV757]|uniref:hypothetical protein n=1 Tax=Leishmania sp. Ghana 2012 LV757 TaxID=2803181 RepID=UPI001B4AAB9F|nr:hypothetical protein GH5_05840 [Leishmania sp. Ghana 2012 LV757]